MSITGSAYQFEKTFPKIETIEGVDVVISTKVYPSDVDGEPKVKLNTLKVHKNGIFAITGIGRPSVTTDATKSSLDLALSTSGFNQELELTSLESVENIAFGFNSEYNQERQWCCKD